MTNLTTLFSPYFSFFASFGTAGHFLLGALLLGFHDYRGLFASFLSLPGALKDLSFIDCSLHIRVPKSWAVSFKSLSVVKGRYSHSFIHHLALCEALEHILMM